MGPVDSGWSGKGRSKGEGAVSLVPVTRGESQHILALGEVRGVLCGLPGPVAPRMGAGVPARMEAKAWAGPPFSRMISADTTSAVALGSLPYT